MTEASSGRLSQIVRVLLFCLPFGPALQNLGLLIGCGMSARRLRQIPAEIAALVRSPAARAAHLFLFGFLFFSILASLLNPSHPKTDLFGYFMGFAPLLLGPAFFARMAGPEPEQGDLLQKLFTLILIFWAGIVLSQALIGWRIQGASLDLDPFFQRARGFYSHPLTLAYVALLLFPYVQLQLLSEPKNAWRQCAFGSVIILLVFSQSRMVQILVFALGLWNIVQMLSGRIRLLLLFGTLASGTLMMATDNPMSHRFSVLFSEQNPDQFSSYPDDRLAFWHAHAEMIKDRPILGHGVHLNHEYRKPYYERIGLADFPKKYEAHNQFIQAWTEGGLLALFCFIGWLLSLALWIKRDMSAPLFKRMALQTLLVFVIGGLTQNAFFDSEVRTVLMVGILLLLIKGLPKQHQLRSP
jgi:O-antigen ligase